jgi:peptide/nickel transport system permease protein
MLKYILKRIGSFIPTILGISIIVFVLIRFIPGDPIEVILGEHATPEYVEIAKHQLGLDKPIYIQYFYWLRNMLMGNWGRSIFSRFPVYYIILNRFKFTIKLSILSMAMVASFGVLLGTLSAYKVGSRIDKFIRIFSILGWSSPHFLTGLILLLIFSVYLGLFPSMGSGGIEHIILPSLTLSVSGITYISRMTRGSLLEVMGQDFVKTAYAKGLTKRRIMFMHIFKNALLPVVTMLGMSLGWFLSGSYIVEIIFSLPGLGELTTTAILDRDYPVVQGCIFFTSIIYCTINLVVDILYTYLDPRVRYERSL